MEKETKSKAEKAALWIAVLLLVLALFQTFQLSSWNAGFGIQQKSGSQAGETNAEMMARMHPEQVARSAPLNDQMVGGC
ncbi:hypothetical protein HYS48_04310 [Candidatus Woesearchaeota archaeon]|nr:hypothetical protein [Candidatus Woesearchaeota archaeon]